MGREGVRVAICARNPERLERAAGDIRDITGIEVLAVPADVSDAGQIERFVDEAVRRFRRIDILVNNAGESAGGPLLETDDAIWQGDLDTKLFGALRCSRLAIPHMIEAGSGRIINVTSIGGKQPEAATGPTTISRAAGIALTKAMSREFAPHGILVNTVCIGLARSGTVPARVGGAPVRRDRPDRGRVLRAGRGRRASGAHRYGGRGRGRHHVPRLGSCQLHYGHGDQRRRWRVRRRLRASTRWREYFSRGGVLS